MLFSNEINEHSIKEQLMTYNKVTGITCMFINEDGNIVFSEGERFKCCAKFQELKGSSWVCSKAHLYASKQSEKIGEPYIFICPSGLVHWAVPVIIKEKFVGGLIGGPVHMERVDEYIVDELVRTNNLSNSSGELLQEYIKTCLWWTVIK